MRKNNIVRFPNGMTHVIVAKFIKKLFEAGWTERDLYRIACRSDEVLDLSELVKVVREEAEMKIDIQKHVVNTDQNPNPNRIDVRLVTNVCFGEIDFNKNKPQLFVCPPELQEDNYFYSGMKKLLDGYKLMNTTMKNYLLKYPQLIPKNWEDKDRIYFLGTITGQPEDMWCDYIHFNKRDSRWYGDIHNLTHWELGNRYHFDKNDAVAIIPESGENNPV